MPRHGFCLSLHAQSTKNKIMKKINALSLLAVALLVFGTLFTSCKKDNGVIEDQQPNTISYSRGVYPIESATIEDRGATYKIRLEVNSRDIDVTLVYPKNRIGKSVDLSQRGSWEFDGEDIDVNGSKVALAEGSYIAVDKYSNGYIWLSYRVRQVNKNGVRAERGNYSGPVYVRHHKND